MSPIGEIGGDRRMGPGNPENDGRTRTRTGRSGLPENHSGREEESRPTKRPGTRYVGTTGEGVERATLSTYERRKTRDKGQRYGKPEEDPSHRFYRNRRSAREPAVGLK